MPKGRERAGVRGHGGQRGERGSYRNAWAEGDYSRLGADQDSDEEAAHTPNVSARPVYCKRARCPCLVWIGNLGVTWQHTQRQEPVHKLAKCAELVAQAKDARPNVLKGLYN